MIILLYLLGVAIVIAVIFCPWGFSDYYFM